MLKKEVHRFLVCLIALVTLHLVWVSPALSGQKIDWGAINPELKGAVSVGKSADCEVCHGDSIEAFAKTLHAKAYHSLYGKEVGSSCEVCHGPMSKHMEAGPEDYDRKLSTVVTFKNLSPQDKNRICLQCHEKGTKMHWRGSTHEMNGVGCSDCHYVMEKRSKKFMFPFKDSKLVCFQCHKDKRAKMYRSAHMPLREGKMDCSSCHNPHGGTGPSMLKSSSVNGTCYTCHQEKRGPLVWEHAPVRENCSTCHDSHGSIHASMLKRKVPYLCQECHSASRHPSTLYDGRNVGGTGTSNQSTFLLGKGCINCHSQIHGSNHPSGARLTR